MPKGIPNKRYTGEFKQKVVETMRSEELNYVETARQFDVPHSRVISWERIYLEEGKEGLYIERRGRACAAAEHGGDAAGKGFFHLLRADKMDVRVHAASGEQAAFARNNLRAGADDHVHIGKLL